MRPDDLALLRTPGVATVSPDGSTAVVAVSRLDVAADEYRSQLWAVPTDASIPARPLTHGHRDSAPVFSPDGRWLAFLGAESGGKPQLHLLPTGGGEARRLTDTARVPEQGRYGTADGVGPEAEEPRLITTLQYRADDLGFTVDRRRHVFVLDLPEDVADDAVPLAEPVQVTSGDHDDSDVAWHPAGTELVFVSARHSRADRDLVTDVYACRPDGSHLRRVTESRSACAAPTYDPGDLEGRTLYLAAQPDLGPDGLDFVGRNTTLCRVEAAGGHPQPLLDPELHDLGHDFGRVVVADGDAFVAVQRQGSVELLRVPLAGASPRRWSTGRSRPAGSRWAGASSSAPSPTTAPPAS